MNSRLLGLRPSVATREVDRSPNAGTGQLHGITSVAAASGESMCRIRCDSISIIARAKPLDYFEAAPVLVATLFRLSFEKGKAGLARPRARYAPAFPAW